MVRNCVEVQQYHATEVIPYSHARVVSIVGIHINFQSMYICIVYNVLCCVTSVWLCYGQQWKTTVWSLQKMLPNWCQLDSIWFRMSFGSSSWPFCLGTNILNWLLGHPTDWNCLSLNSRRVCAQIFIQWHYFGALFLWYNIWPNCCTLSNISNLSWTAMTEQVLSTTVNVKCLSLLH